LDRDRRDKPGDDVVGWFDVIGTSSGVLFPMLESIALVARLDRAIR